MRDIGRWRKNLSSVCSNRYGTIVFAAAREGWWKKVGSSKNLGNLDDIKFRLYSEGNTNHLTVSHKWYVWTINQKYIHIGDLVGEYKTYSMGFVYPPYAVYQKIITGKYPFHELK